MVKNQYSSRLSTEKLFKTPQRETVVISLHLLLLDFLISRRSLSKVSMLIFHLRNDHEKFQGENLVVAGAVMCSSNTISQ